MQAKASWIRLIFYTGLALLATHELDAVARHEWRLLPILSGLDDETGRAAFIMLHVPLFAVLFWLVSHPDPVIERRSQLGLDAFLVLHASIHAALSGHALYEFEGWIESITVYGGAVIGIIHGILLMRHVRRA